MIDHPPGELVDIGSRQLWVEREGSGSPLLFLGGFGPAGSHVVLHPHLSPLAVEHELIYVDLWGRGRSGKPADLTEITFASDVADLVALLGRLDLGPVNLYGFSYGGLLAQALALDHPALVRRLVVANSLHSGEMWQRNHENLNRELANQFPEVWREIGELRRQGLLSTDPRLRPLFGRVGAVARFFNPDNAHLIATEPGDRNLELYPLFVGADVDFIIGGQLVGLPDFRTRLAELRQPMMVLAGRFDRALYPALQYEFADHVPHVQLHILERSGSWSHVEEPATVLALVGDFLRD